MEHSQLQKFSCNVLKIPNRIVSDLEIAVGLAMFQFDFVFLGNAIVQGALFGTFGCTDASVRRSPAADPSASPFRPTL